jgi:general stress protein 26
MGAAATDGMRRKVSRAIRTRRFCTLATCSGSGDPHAVGVMYVAVDGVLYVHTVLGNKKVRNICENSRVAVCIPVRRFPVGPPYCVQFQGAAEVLAKDDPEIASLLRSGRLKRIVGLGVLDEPDTCFLRIEPDGTFFTYGIGVPLRKVLRDPINATDRVQLETR